MNAKQTMFASATLFLLSVSPAANATVVFETEPVYDFFRDGQNTRARAAIIGSPPSPQLNYSSMPLQRVPKKEKMLVINPRTHRWAAYSADGKLLRSGRATAGASWCPDIGRSCRTKTGTFRIYSLGSRGCYSKKFPVGQGGAPMPYCMFFNGGQAVHGSYNVVNGNASHGCVRVTVSDATWIRFNFATIGTKVVVKTY